MTVQKDHLNDSVNTFVQAVAVLLKDMTAHLATKDDIANMATKDDIANMATKDDIANMATKDDIANMATKDDIANMATKDDINKLSEKIKGLEESVADGYKRIYLWKDDMYKTFVRKEDLQH